MEWLYIIAASLFVVGLKMLGSAATARRGNVVSAVGMLLAVVATLLQGGLHFTWIIAGVLVGSAVGAVAAYRVKMTAMPEMVALFNGFGGLASLLVGWAEYHMHRDAEPFTAASIFLAVLIGGITFTGSVLAFAKLSERVTGKPVMFGGQQLVNVLLFAVAILCGIMFTLRPEASYAILILGVVVSLVLGVLAVLPIGGADMPVVISLLNSYSGLAAAAAGFVLGNQMLIVAGSLVGASGIVLTQIMCKAMNRSLTNVLFSGFGSAVTSGAAAAGQGEAKALSPADAYFALEAARSIVIVPGYGMAVAQAQHVVKELADHLEANGVEVKYAIHPVAGRMPGHMNVLLAEADVPYDQLVEMDGINPTMPTVDVAIVIGANDVVNPAAREDKSSPIYGMPIINVDQARMVYVLKRSMASGFAGVENPLFLKENTRMIFGDAKKTLQALLNEFKGT
ncbi:MAG TPA: NAD(P)(+) transhydrogenase (Re/Si-specific) subunit beta [Chthoniobacterales bacterium]|nr:NAD(P)(+) transhydrogenase (Re/Si-specific) subunit beta [Chthoniobacterales bacterium]